ncbi:MAG: right-handed parallel beta-helix repeat-containing protein [Elusimicrobia bacterium]|nr:right-handed parallel beta-helix repeat-containing protein [Elusimicrobiota bacterium]
MEAYCRAGRSRRWLAAALAGIASLLAVAGAEETAVPAPELAPIDLSSLGLPKKTPPSDACQFLRDQLADPSVREVILPAGTYVCAKPVVMNRDGVTLRGQGRPLLKLADYADSPLLVLGRLDDGPDGVPPPVTGLLVEGIVLDGNRAHQRGECWGGPCDTGGTTGVRNNGLTLRGVRDSAVRDVEILGARSGGLVTERDCARIHVTGLKARDSFFDGLSVNWTRDSVFEKLDLAGNAFAGLTMDVRVTGNVFRDGDVSANRDVGIFLRRADANRFERLRVADNASHGVFLSDADGQAGSCAVDNVFSQVEASRNGRDGFHMDRDCPGNRLLDCAAAGNKGEQVHGAWVPPSAPRP